MTQISIRIESYSPVTGHRCHTLTDHRIAVEEQSQQILSLLIKRTHLRSDCNETQIAQKHQNEDIKLPILYPFDTL